MATKLFVGNLSFHTTPADLESLFGQAGAVASVNVISDKFSGQSRGFGFVEMGESGGRPDGHRAVQWLRAAGL